jgi:hypothetical protein
MQMLPDSSAVLPLVGVLIGAGLQYLFGRTLESRKQLSLQKSQAYADYFRSFAALATHGESKEALANAADAKTRVCIYGSSEIMRRLVEFEDLGSAANTDESRMVIARMCKDMRRDIGMRDEGFDERDLYRILFGRPGRPSAGAGRHGGR